MEKGHLFQKLDIHMWGNKCNLNLTVFKKLPTINHRSKNGENIKGYLSDFVLDCLLIPDIILKKDKAFSDTCFFPITGREFLPWPPWLCDQVFRAPSFNLIKSLAKHYRWVAFYMIVDIKVSIWKHINIYLL